MLHSGTKSLNQPRRDQNRVLVERNLAFVSVQRRSLSSPSTSHPELCPRRAPFYNVSLFASGQERVTKFANLNNGSQSALHSNIESSVGGGINKSPKSSLFCSLADSTDLVVLNWSVDFAVSHAVTTGICRVL